LSCLRSRAASYAQTSLWTSPFSPNCWFFSGRLAPSSVLLEDGFGHVCRHFGVLGELHRVSRPPLRHGAQGGGVTEHFRKRNLGEHDFSGGALLHALDEAATTAQVAVHVAHELVGSHDLDLLDRLEQDWPCLGAAFLE